MIWRIDESQVFALVLTMVWRLIRMYDLQLANCITRTIMTHTFNLLRDRVSTAHVLAEVSSFYCWRVLLVGFLLESCYDRLD